MPWAVAVSFICRVVKKLPVTASTTKNAPATPISHVLLVFRICASLLAIERLSGRHSSSASRFAER
jgi:hypothetical protein